METRLSSASREVVISADRPTVLIGERINPTGKKKLAEALRAGKLEPVKAEALAQLQAGADVIDVNVGAFGVDEIDLLARAVQTLMGTVDVPLCIDSANPDAVEAALKVYRGRALVNSVNGEERSLSMVLAMVKEHDAAVIALTQDENGIPADAAGRAAIAGKIVRRAEAMGISRDRIVIDCLTLALGANESAGRVTLEAIRRIKDELGVNQTVGASNISFGLPERDLLNGAFLSLAIEAGVTCPIVDAARVRPVVLATDLVLGRDKRARRYIQDYRARQIKNQNAK
ncbi:MAG: dihydropteroate synthase [Chloroflexi bacterium]|nr:dihydropteroate synthase [Chloroflexota bacterium]